MALTYKIDKFTDAVDENNVTKKLVGFRIKDEQERTFVIDKWITLVAGKTDESYITEAQAEGQAEIDAWVESFVNVGKTWNPDTSTME